MAAEAVCEDRVPCAIVASDGEAPGDALEVAGNACESPVFPSWRRGTFTVLSWNCRSVEWMCKSARAVE